MIIAQITDSHVEQAGVLTYNIFDAAASLKRVIQAINARDPQPDLVLHTGDLVHHGAPEQYGPLREILEELTVPFYALPGNHDSREGFRAGFSDMEWLPDGGSFIQYGIEEYPLRILCLDTVIPGVPHGALCDVRLSWLAERLAAAPDHPTVVACHHPPFATGLTGTAMTGLESGGGAFAKILAGNPQVQRLICGHVHRPIATMFGGRSAWASPATCYQFEAGMSEERTLALSREPPGYSIHIWLEDPATGPALVSHFVPVGDFGEPIDLIRNGVRVGPDDRKAR